MKKKTVLSVEELTKLNGVGEKLAEVLHKSGWGDIEKLAQAKIENLIALQGIREKTAQKIIDAAKEYNASEKKEDLKEEKTQEQACEPVSIEEDKPEKKE